jgi:hypothetical protein
MAKQDDYVRYTVRIPSDLYERVKSASGEASVNSLIVELLLEKFPEPSVNADLVLQLMQHIAEEANTSMRATMIADLNQMLAVNGATFRAKTDPDDGLFLEVPDYEALKKQRADELAKALNNIEIKQKLRATGQNEE